MADVRITEKEALVLAVLKAAKRPMTLAEISEAAGTELAPGSITALVHKKGKVRVAEMVKVDAPAKRKVGLYALKSTAKLEGKKFNATETDIVNALKSAEAPMSLAEISDKVGYELKPGNINALLTIKGSVEKVGERETSFITKRKVGTYTLV